MKSLINTRRLLALTLVSVLGWSTAAQAEPASDVGRTIAAQGNLALQQIRASGAARARDHLAERLTTESGPSRDALIVEHAALRREIKAATLPTDRNAQARLAH